MIDEALKDLADYILEKLEGKTGGYIFAKDELVLKVDAG